MKTDTAECQSWRLKILRNPNRVICGFALNCHGKRICFSPRSWPYQTVWSVRNEKCQLVTLRSSRAVRAVIRFLTAGGDENRLMQVDSSVLDGINSWQEGNRFQRKHDPLPNLKGCLALYGTESGQDTLLGKDLNDGEAASRVGAAVFDCLVERMKIRKAETGRCTAAKRADLLWKLHDHIACRKEEHMLTLTLERARTDPAVLMKRLEEEYVQTHEQD